MPRFMICGYALVPLGDDPGLLLSAYAGLYEGLLDIHPAYGIPALYGSLYGSLIEDIFQIRSRGACSGPGQPVKIHVIIESLVAAMELKYLLPGLDIGLADSYLAVKTPGPHDGRVEYVHPVGGSHDYDALVLGKAIHLHQELVEGLLPFIVRASESRASSPRYRIYLVYEYYTGT